MSDKITRRLFVGSMGAASIASASTLLAPANAAGGETVDSQRVGTAQPVNLKATYTFFNSAEAQFIEAACERLIPADELGPGALGAWVPNYLDKQLGGAWGSGERLYRSGPWIAGSPSQGYQLPFTPAELFRAALGAINRSMQARGSPFSGLSPESQDDYLRVLAKGGPDLDLDGVPSDVFFDLLLKMTVEGFFSDPAYGGNHDMVAWRMIGFPGAYADYYDAIDRHGVKFEREPMSLAEDSSGHLHPDPNIPAHL